MPTVADYAVLLDESKELKTGETFETIPFFRPPGFVKGTNLAKAILAYKVNPRSNGAFAPNAHFHIASLGFPAETVHHVKVGDIGLCGIWETFPATGFGENIGTRFLFSMEEGRARFSDIILWYQVEV